MDAVFEQVENIFFTATKFAALAVELVGVVVALYTVVRAVVGAIKKDKKMRLKLAQGTALALEFKMVSELLRTVYSRTWQELLLLGIVIVLRAAMAILIHWEIKTHKKDYEELFKNELKQKHEVASAKKDEGKKDEEPLTAPAETAAEEPQKAEYPKNKPAAEENSKKETQTKA